jgi:hypothetical protein
LPELNSAQLSAITTLRIPFGWFWEDNPNSCYISHKLPQEGERLVDVLPHVKHVILSFQEKKSYDMYDEEVIRGMNGTREMVTKNGWIADDVKVSVLISAMNTCEGDRLCTYTVTRVRHVLEAPRVYYFLSLTFHNCNTK